MSQWKKCLFPLVCALLVSSLPIGADESSEERESPAQGEDLRFQRTEFFEIYGTDSESLRAWMRMTAQVEEVFGQFFHLPRQFPNRIIILLRDAEDFGEDGPPYHLEERSGVRVFAEVRWDENLSQDTARRILVESFLWRWARWQRIPRENAGDFPPWVKEAIALDSASRGDITWRAGMMDALREEGPFPIAELLSPREGENVSRRYRYSALTLLRFMRGEGRRSRLLELYLLRFLRGEDPLEALKAVFGERMGSEENPELWWLTGATELIQNRAQAIKPAEATSLDWQEKRRLLFVDEEGERKEVWVHDWWDNREDPMVRALLERRLQRLSLDLDQIHPFYFNTFLGMGRFVDAVLQGHEERARQFLGEMEEDYSRADQMQREMQEVLDQWEARMNE